MRGAVKDLLKAKGIKKTGLVKDLNGSLRVPNKGMKHRLSLQVLFLFYFVLFYSQYLVLLNNLLTYLIYC